MSYYKECLNKIREYFENNNFFYIQEENQIDCSNLFELFLDKNKKHRLMKLYFNELKCNEIKYDFLIVGAFYNSFKLHEYILHCKKIINILNDIEIILNLNKWKIIEKITREIQK